MAGALAAVPASIDTPGKVAAKSVYGMMVKPEMMALSLICCETMVMMGMEVGCVRLTKQCRMSATLMLPDSAKMSTFGYTVSPLMITLNSRCCDAVQYTSMKYKLSTYVSS